MASHTVTVQESKADRDTLGKNKYHLQVAKSVSSRGKDPDYNVVFKSAALAPNMEISWTTEYALNWMSDVPTKGAKVTASGDWQACKPGQSFDLNETGGWVANQSNPNFDKDSLNVGKNGYSTPVNIVVGVKDPAAGNWSPIWVGKDQLIVNGHGEYQPRESVQIWFDEGEQTATMISGQSSDIESFEMTKIKQHWFHYDVKGGKWEDQDQQFDLSESNPFLFSSGYEPLIWIRTGVSFDGLKYLSTLG